MKRLFVAFTLACLLSGTAFAGEMPGGGKSATGDMPGVGSPTAPPQPVQGDMMPGGDSATSSETSLVTTVLLAFITLIGR
jgi:hypothetical protein